MDTDWQPVTMHSFAPGVAEKIGFYVYLLIDPRGDVIFYVGKGTANRCFAHLAEARKTSADSIGDSPKLARIREIEAAGMAVEIDILRHGLYEHEAYLVESVAIDLVDPDANRVVGHDTTELGRRSVLDINVAYGAKPVEIHPQHRVVLIRINRLFERGMSDNELYEATRKWWRIGRPRRQLGTARAPEWAMAVFGGVVRAVYRIEEWEQVTARDVEEDPTRDRRWAFLGRRDQEMEANYLYRDVSTYLKSAAQNPIRYINCK